MKQSFALFLNSKIDFSKKFSLDELVHKTKILFESEGMPGFLSMLLLCLDQLLVMHLKGSDSNHSCCEKPHLINHKKESKHIKTSCGEVEISWTRMKCKTCGKTFIPLKNFLNLENYQRKTSELEKIVIDVLADQSFRRASKAILDISGSYIPHTSLHSWFFKTESDEISKKKRVKTLMPDGSGYKKHPKFGDPDESYSKKEIKVVIGINEEGNLEPYGVWSRKTWDEISREIKTANHPNKKLYFKPVAEMLVSDGEENLIRAMKRLTKTEQRCQWHLYKNLYQPMRIQDEAPLKEVKKSQFELSEILDIKLPEEDFDEVSLEDKLELEIEMKNADKELMRFVHKMIDRGYDQTAKYVLRAKEQMFSYVKFWLKTGVVNPRVSSFIERIMREIGRRLKKIGYNWSPKGAEKMANIILKKVTSKKEWESWWKKKLNFTDCVDLSFEGCVPI